MIMDLKKTPEYRLWRAIFTVSDGIHDAVLRNFLQGSNDISMKQHMVMKKVCDMMEATPQGIPLKDLAAALHLTPGTVSELVETLVRRGSLKRVQNPDDRRAVMITVTEQSLKMLREAEQRINEYIKGLWEDLSAEEKATVTAALETLSNRVKRGLNKG